MHPDIQELLLDRQTIADKVAELGRRISRDYEGQSITAVCILKGASVFFADLIRAIEVPVAIDFMAVSSYGQSTKSSGVMRILKDLDQDVEGKRVLLVEDIVDTGLTLHYLRDYLLDRRPASLRLCALLDKPERRVQPIEVDYLGFQIPDVFVVGYGLDYAERYRNLPHIGVLKPEVYRS